MAAKVLLAGACLLLLAVTPACGNSKESDYLDEVRGAWALSEARFESFGETMEQAWPSIRELFRVLVEEGAGTAYDATLEAIEQLDPPQRFRADHDRMLQGIRDLLALDRTIGGSLASQDLETFVLSNSGLGETNSLMQLDLHPAVCRAVSTEDNSRCNRADPMPGGAYGSELYTIMGRFVARFGPRTVGVSIPPLARNEREVLGILAKLQPEVVTIVEETRAKVRQLEPPADLQVDHNRLLRYFDEQLEEIQTVPIVATQQNIGRLVGSGLPAPSAFCQAQEELSSAIEPIVRVYFGDDSGLCAENGPR